MKHFLQHGNECAIHSGCDLDALRAQTICFLGRCTEKEHCIPWRDNRYPLLWRYKLQGFCFTRDFAINAAADNYLGDRDRALNWISDWIQRNPVDSDAGWDAWPVSERLLNWSMLIAVFHLHEEEVRAAFLRQMRWLKKWIEYDLRANHLLKNACALAVSACLVNEQVCLAHALKLLHEQINEQILPDGGHIERSPMYHAHVLWDCLLVYAVLEEKPTFLADALIKMCAFLNTITHPDGEIPLFGDSALKEAAPTQALVRLAMRLLPHPKSEPGNSSVRDRHGVALEPSGYYCMGDQTTGDFMIVKTAPPLPPWQPGHSHADMLSYELSLSGRRVIVDSGVHGYAESVLRGYCRSTRAHNTVQLDSLEQSDWWKVFRIGQRPKADTPRFEVRPDFISLEAAYEHFSGYRHCRCIHYSPDRHYWEVEDTVKVGSGSHEVKSVIHLHPEIRVTGTDREILLSTDSVNFRITLCTEGTLEFKDICSSGQDNWYCPEFGQSLPSATIIMRHKGASPLTIGYTIFFD
ncbi:MAG TPA: alginate lyase family protein [Candidatus Hydrogenedentes bacterium]|jgi:uncharacterized heparinase superfamily protein|nr:alginate lyase family protein [Candidatus Hydrogenedentota bacterium]